MTSVRVILEVIASIKPGDVAAAQDYINKHAGKPSGGSGGGSAGGGTIPKPPTPPILPKPKPPIIASEAVAGPPDDFFTPMRIYGQGFAASEKVALIQVLGSSQAALAPAASDPTGRIDVTISLATHTHYNVFALGVKSNVPSNTIGIAVP